MRQNLNLTDLSVKYYNIKSMAPRIVDKDAKRKEILNAALRVFARNGFSASRIIDVAREAGIGKGTVYEYFHSKEEIFLALYEEMKTEFHQRIFIIDEGLPPQEKLKRFITSALSAFEEWKDLSRVLLDFWAEQRDGGSLDFRFDELYDEARVRLAGLVREGIKAGSFRKIKAMHVASLLIAIVDGLMLQWVFNPESFSLKQVSKVAIEVVLEGLSDEDTTYSTS